MRSIDSEEYGYAEGCQELRVNPAGETMREDLALGIVVYPKG